MLTAMLLAGLLAGLPAPAPRSSPIVGGEPVEDDEFPLVVAVFTSTGANGSGFLCTGTLVHPNLVLTAAHCLTEAASTANIRVLLGEDISAFDFEAEVLDFATHPDFCRECDSDIADFAYIEIDDLVSGDPSIFARPIVQEDEMDLVEVGSRVMLVGFGEDDDGNSGAKRKVETTIRDYPSASEFLAGSDGKDSCLGDSGGPALVEDEEGVWRLAGIVSRGYPECGLGGLYTIPASYMCWVEDETGIDLRGECTECDCLSFGSGDDDDGCRVAAKPGPARNVDWLALALGLGLVAGQRRRSRSIRGA